jgi:hypothetical protein
MGRQEEHFHISAPPLEVPGVTEDGFAIVSWENLIVDDEDTSCSAPVIIYQDLRFCAYNRFACVLCQKWISRGRSPMGHDNQHLKTHARRLDEYAKYTDTHEMSCIVIRLILERGEPASLLPWCRQRFPEVCGVLPWEHSFRDMTKLMKDELEGKLMRECEASGDVSLAMDGWSDPRGRRYQGVTVPVRTPADHMLQTETH